MNDQRQLSEAEFELVKNIRHDIHRYPEDGFCEFKTSGRIVKELEKLGIELEKNVAKTGVVGLIRGKHPGKTVLLRADMDAVFVEEKADVEYKSQVPGMMHACGHDGHVAGLLGAAMILNRQKEILHGNVKLMFQPAEERDGGAQRMIEEGVLENPKVDAAFGAHLWGEMKEGTVQVKTGAIMAAPDMFRFKVIGKGGHGAIPHLAIDPITITCQVIGGIQNIVSRRTNPMEPVVVSCCTIHGGDSFNVIPGEVTVEGTIRTLSEETREWVARAIEEVIKGVTESQGATYEFDYLAKYPVLVNDGSMTSIAKKAIEKVVGKDQVSEAIYPTTAGEDFAYIAREVPSSFFFVGIAEDENQPVLHHNPYFKWEDKNIRTLAECLANVAMEYLEQ